MKNFTNLNKNFWSSFPAKICDKKVLIEEPSIPVVNHVNAIFSVILNQAKSLTPVWLCNNNTKDIELLKSYVPTAEFIVLPKVSWFGKIRMMLTAIWKFAIMYLTKDILSFSYDGVKYGDIVYDTYLAREQVGTVRKIDNRVWSIVYNCIRRHEDIRRSLSSDNFEAVLVGHHVGRRSGVMLRAALRHGYKGYVRLGHHEPTFQCFGKLDEICDCVTPTPGIIDRIIAELGPEFDNVYRLVLEKEISGKGSKDGVFAFSSNNKYYKDRKSFTRDFGIDHRKKNVFVMLHALNDYPHARRWILFKDYYEWFIETLKFAEKNDNVNWIFKQHPSIKFYITRDISFDSLFLDIPKNVIYISENNQLDLRSLLYCADLVITCIGSAGFELPAMGGIPSLTAGDNFYAGLGFVLEPKTKEEYFKILDNAQNIERLTPQQQKKAQAAYIYIHEFSKVPMSACPLTSLEQERDKNQDLWYWKEIAERYERYGEVIKDEVGKYINEVAEPNFSRLNGGRGHLS